LGSRTASTILFALALPNVELAVETIARLTQETEGFDRRIGRLPAG